MPRSAQVVVAGCPHHVTQRGNNRQDVFFVDEDRQYYLRTLREQSARHGLNIEADPAGLLNLPPWNRRLGNSDWRESLAKPQDDLVAARLRLCTSRGRPLGSDSFMAKLEHALGRRLRPLPEGRPRKQKTKGEPGERP